MKQQNKKKFFTFMAVVMCLLFLVSLSYSMNNKGSKKTKLLIPNTYNSTVANVWTRLSNFGFIGHDAFVDPSFEWPGGTNNHHLYQGSIWVTGKDSNFVIHCTAPDEEEITLTFDMADTVRLYDANDLHFHNRPNVHPSLADSQVSAEDTYAEYTDLDPGRHNQGESPLGIKIIERTYKWTDSNYYNFIIFDFQIINIGLDTNGDLIPDVQQNLTDVYVGIRFDADVSFVAGGDYWYDDLVDYDTLIQTSYIYDGDDPDRPGDDTGENGLSTGYIYAKLLNASGGTPFTSLADPVSHTWWTIDEDPGSDVLKFDYMSIPGYKILSDSVYDYRFLQSVGPFNMEPSDIVNVVWACGINNGIDSVRMESAWAKSIYDNEYIITDPTYVSNPFNNNQVDKFVLNQNYPNPFNPNTTIEFSLPIAEFITLKIYDVLGQEVATLVSEQLNPGLHKYSWNASGFVSGVYYYRINTSSGFAQTKKLLLLK